MERPAVSHKCVPKYLLTYQLTDWRWRTERQLNTSFDEMNWRGGDINRCKTIFCRCSAKGDTFCRNVTTRYKRVEEVVIDRCSWLLITLPENRELAKLTGEFPLSQKRVIWHYHHLSLSLSLSVDHLSLSVCVVEWDWNERKGSV